MHDTPVRIRRCRRTDFVDVMRLLAVDEPAPVAERRTLRRFRAIVNDLGGDLYVALIDEAIAGLVHVTYARQLAVPPRARMERLVVAEGARGRRIGAALFEFARRRAIRRGCGTLTCSVPANDDGSAGFLEKLGMRRDGHGFAIELPVADTDRESEAGRRE
jgi:ribosomal protein S18 acetylase RimI-like enzyme